jgi:hypothetical protein
MKTFFIGLGISILSGLIVWFIVNSISKNNNQEQNDTQQNQTTTTPTQDSESWWQEIWNFLNPQLPPNVNLA